jgi:hypothetical protein
MASASRVVVWCEGDWRCDFQPGVPGQPRLEVYHRGRLVTTETAPSGPPSHLRAEVLRQRLLRGDLREN